MPDLEARVAELDVKLTDLLAAEVSDPATIAEGYAQYGPLKTDAASAVIEALQPIQARYRDLMADPAAQKLTKPVRLFAAGAPPSPTLIARMSELNFQLDHVYGLTEVYGPFTINVPPPGLSLQLRREIRGSAPTPWRSWFSAAV